MNNANEKKETESSCCCNCDYSLAFLLLRGWLAVRAILAGVEKYGAYKSVQKPLLDMNGQPDPSGAMLDVKMKFYSPANYHGIPATLRAKFENEVLLPGFSLNLFDKLLGPILIISGIMLLIGLGTRVSLMVQGIIYIALSVGLILINQPDGIAYLGIHLGLVAGALLLAKHNKLTLLKKW